MENAPISVVELRINIRLIGMQAIIEMKPILFLISASTRVFYALINDLTD